MELWNEINLPLPLYSNCEISRSQLGKNRFISKSICDNDLILDIEKFTKVLQETIEFLRNSERFHAEAAQLSRLIFLNCKQFRMMKGLNEMKKSQQALLRYLNMDTATAIETFKGFITEDNSSTVSVPYQQNLDYILIRLQGLAKLLIRVVSCSRKCATYFLGLIKAGSFYSKGVVFLSTLASIWSQSREFCKFSVQQFNKLREYRDCLKVKPGLGWIDGEYEIPRELELWLGDEWTYLIMNETYDVKLLLKKADIDGFIEKRDEMSAVLRNIKVEDYDEMIKDEQSPTIIEPSKKSNEGLELELEDFKPIPRNIKIESVEIESLDHSMSSLISKVSITKFIKNESNYRKVNPQKSLTISKMRKKIWKEFRDDIKNKSVLMQEGALISYVNDYLEEYKIGK